MCLFSEMLLLSDARPCGNRVICLGEGKAPCLSVHTRQEMQQEWGKGRAGQKMQGCAGRCNPPFSRLGKGRRRGSRGIVMLQVVFSATNPLLLCPPLPPSGAISFRCWIPLIRFFPFDRRSIHLFHQISFILICVDLRLLCFSFLLLDFFLSFFSFFPGP